MVIYYLVCSASADSGFMTTGILQALNVRLVTALRVLHNSISYKTCVTFVHNNALKLQALPPFHLAVVTSNDDYTPSIRM